MPQSPERTKDKSRAQCPEALLQIGHCIARPAPFFPDLHSNSNDQDVWQECRKVQRPLLDQSRQWCYPQEDTRAHKLEQGHANEYEEVPAETDTPDHIAPQ